MPLHLKRYQEAQHHHFITFSCHGRLPFLADPEPKSIVEEILERTRARHNARIYAYVLMQRVLLVASLKPTLSSDSSEPV